jgi:hypothetical protein
MVEDIAHIVVRAEQQRVVSLLDEYFAQCGYHRVSVRGRAHLLGQVDWASPLNPPPKHRCVMVFPSTVGWTTSTDELDLLDQALANWLSLRHLVITATGSRYLGEFTYRVLEQGVALSESELDSDLRSTLSFIRSNPDHLTKFSYDDLGIYFRSGATRVTPVLLGFARS